jgi:hypothetical protein
MWGKNGDKRMAVEKSSQNDVAGNTNNATKLEGSKLSRLPTQLTNVEEDIFNRVPTLYSFTVCVTHA